MTDATIIGIRHLPLPWSQLRTLKAPAALDTCHDMLRATEELMDWTVQLLPPTSISYPPSAGFQHSRLTSLNVDFFYTKFAGQIRFFFSALTLPSLRSFFLKTGSRPAGETVTMDAESQQSIVSFFRRSSPPLTIFHASFRTIPRSDDFLISRLECTPSLVELEIYISRPNKLVIADQFMRRLNAEYPDFVLPNLEKLSLNGYLMFTSESIGAMVASRRRPAADQTVNVATLQLLRLELIRARKLSPSEVLKPFISDGLLVDLWIIA